MNDAFDIARRIAGTTDPQVTHYLHSTVIVSRRGQIIAKGRNHWRGQIISTAEGPIRRTIHSEVHALEQVNIRRLTDAIVINYCRTAAHTLLARPCDNCWSILQNLGLKKIFYSVRSELDRPLWKEERFE